MTALQEASIEQLLEIDGLGDIIAYSVKTYFEQPSVQELIQELQDSGVNMTYLGVTKTTQLLQDTSSAVRRSY